MRQSSFVLAVILALVAPLAASLDAPGSSAASTAPDGEAAWSLPPGPPLRQAAAALREADARHLGPAMQTDLPQGHLLPSSLPLSALVLDWMAAHGQRPTAQERLDLAALDTLPTATMGAFAEVLHAFRMVEATTHAAYADPARPDFASIASAQHRLLDATADLDEAIQRHGVGTTTARQGPIAVGSLLAIDIAGFDDVYTQNYILVIDTGGADTYQNNAGGNAFATSHCSSDSDPLPRQPTVASLIDLAGNDLYRPGRDCGTNGGGAYGVGMVIDAAGNDRYEARGLGANGGGYAHGIGTLVDAAGSDVYSGTGAGLNGGGYAGGYGRLIDLRGNDGYTASDYGSNGGARGAWHCVNMCQEAKVSHGILVDLGGSDSYWDLVVRGNDRTVVPKETTGAQLDLVVT